MRHCFTRGALAVLATSALLGCPAAGTDFHAQWAAKGRWVQPPEVMNTEASDPGDALTVIPVTPEVDADEQVEASPVGGLRRTYAHGPMVFGERSSLHYKLLALGNLLPLGSMAMEVKRFETMGTGIQLELETQYSVAGFPGQQSWKVLLDSAWIQVDGKPMLPQHAEPGMYWPSINGHAYFAGLERVQTDLGVFDGCWKVLYVEGTGEPTEGWFAPGMGLVKARFTLAGMRVEAQLTRVKD